MEFCHVLVKRIDNLMLKIFSVCLLDFIFKIVICIIYSFIHSFIHSFMYLFIYLVILFFKEI